MIESLGTPVRRAIHQTRQWLLASQQADGSWCAELEGDTILESETILLLTFLGHEDSDLAGRLAAHLVEKQLPDGGWAMYPGGAAEVSGSVKAYFALKLTGHDAGAEYMRRARAAIMARGGADAVNSFSRFYLALLGQISYEQCPAVPPEIVLLPKWFPVNLYAVSAWTRTIIVPLSIISALSAGVPDRAAAGHPRTVSAGARELAAAAVSGSFGRHRPAELGPPVPHDRQAAEVVAAAATAAAEAQGPGRSRTLDAHPLRPQRRPGGDLSADGLEHDRRNAWGIPTTAPKCNTATRSCGN